MVGRRRLMLLLVSALAVLAVALACSSNDAAEVDPDTDTTSQRFPDVIAVSIDGSDGTYDFDVTVSSPYDTPERYADGWRVLAPDGTVLGERPLAHDHADEQPFTRSLTDVEIPAGIRTVMVEARDLENGYGGGTVTEQVPDR